MEADPERLSQWPWIVVRVSCRLCPRRGRYRLARLAEKYGAECELAVLLDALAFDCPHHRPGVKPRKYEAACGVRFTDLDRSRPPPDLPPALARLTLGIVRR